MIDILATGPLCTVQDAGRRGYRNVGVSVSGVMDPLAYRIGNTLVGNDDGAAVVEITVFPFKAIFREHARVAVTGAACRATLDGLSIPPWWVFDVSAGQTLSLSAPSNGARAYVAVRGGIDVPEMLGSRSTDLKVGFGGYQGRSLRRGDLLAIGGHTDQASTAEASFGVAPPDKSIGIGPPCTRGVVAVRVVPGPEYDAFSVEGIDRFWTTEWRVTPDSNRIGYRLDGAPVALKRPLEMLSHGIVPGVIQIPPDGRPIVMMADAQTSGGYPKVGTVIQADLWRLAQAPLGSRIRFEQSTVTAAVEAMTLQQRYIDDIGASMWRAQWKAK